MLNGSNQALTKTQFAKHVGLSGARISQLLKAGLPVRADGKIDVQAAEAWMAVSLNPSRRAAAQRRSDRPDARAAEYEHARAAALKQVTSKAEKEALHAELLRVQLAEREGRLIDRATAEATVFTRARAERDAWRNLPARIAPRMAAALRVDEHAVFELLDKAIAEQLVELAATPLEVLRARDR